MAPSYAYTISTILVCLLSSQAPKSRRFPPDLLASEHKSVIVCLTCTVDLDKGIVQPSLGGMTADLWLRARTATELYIVALKGATIARLKSTSNPCVACKSLDYSAREIPVADIKPTDYFCLKTNRGRVVYFKVTEAGNAEADGLVLEYSACDR